MKNWEARIMGNKKASEIDRLERKMKKQRGGKRKGSGRKKKEPTVVKRIPLSQVKNVENLLKKSNGK